MIRRRAGETEMGICDMSDRWNPSGIFAPHPNPTRRYLSLGLGVQSTTMLLMADEGAFGPKPDVAFFADTQDEPDAVYAHLRRLQGSNSLTIPIKTMTAGRLRDHVTRSLNTTGGRFASAPFYVRSPDGADVGKNRRQCTREFKLEPLWAAIRADLGIAPGKRVPRGVVVETWVGITTDEVHRASASKHRWEHKRHPLIEAAMSRGDCIEWLRRREIPVPVKSRCIFCPFTSNEEWRRIKADDPEQWDDAVVVDAAIRRGGAECAVNNLCIGPACRSPKPTCARPICARGRSVRNAKECAECETQNRPAPFGTGRHDPESHLT